MLTSTKGLTMSKIIPEMMTAIINHGPNDYRLETVPTPKAGPGELLVKVGACGICASDVKCHSGAHMFWEKTLGLRPRLSLAMSSLAP